MKKRMNLLSVAVLAMLAMGFESVYCQDSTEKDLIKDATQLSCNPANSLCTAELGPFSITLAGDQEYTVNIIIPADMEILDAYMRLAPAEEEETPTGVAIFLGGQTICNPQEGLFTGFTCREELRDSMKTYFEENKREYTVSVPLVFTSQGGGVIQVKEFTVKYRITPVDELESVLNPDTGAPEHLFWKPSAGPSPRYELEIRSEDFLSPSGDILLTESGITGAYYKLTEEDIEKLGPIEHGKVYFWGVRVDYGEAGKSRWTVAEFVIMQRKLPSVENLQVAKNTKTEIVFYWENPGNAECYEIALNSHTPERCYGPSYRIEKTNYDTLQGLCLCGENTVTVWAVYGEEKSGPEEISFPLEMARLPAPDRDSLRPNCKKPEKTENFSFRWGEIVGAWKYDIRLYDSDDNLIRLPFRNEYHDTVRISSIVYDPWGEEINGESLGLDLKAGETYRWEVRAVPGPITENPDTGEPIVESEWAVQMFLYQPVLLRMLVLYAAVGGILGGFIRIAHEEKMRAKKEERKFDISLNTQTGTDLLVGLIIGIMFYLLVNQTLSQQLNPLNIPAFSYAGSVILGFVGGIISYDLTRLRRALPE